MGATTYSGKRVWTEAELEALPEDGCLHEVVDGELIKSPKNNFFHGRICTRLSAALHTYSSAHRLGVVLDSSTGFWRRRVGPGASLDGENLLPGFSFPITDLFKDWDWE